MNDPMRSTQESVMSALKVVKMSTTTDGTQNTVPPTRAIICDSAETADLYFADAPTTKITIKLLAGMVYPFSVVAVKFSDVCHALY